MVKSVIDVQAEDGGFSAFMETPEHLPAPVVIVLHEIFGVNKDIRLTYEELARAGFIAIAPDLFWRAEAGLDLNSWSEEEWRKGLALYASYDREAGVRDITAVVQVARTLQGSTGRVGVIGFCLGGLMSFFSAAHQDPDAAVAYHGGETDQYLDRAAGISAPILLHLAEDDEFISKEAQAKIVAAMANVAGAKVCSYPNQKHAFARHTGLHYDGQAAALANGRTIAFLAERLGLQQAS